MAYAIGTLTKGAGDDCHKQLLGIIKTIAEANGWVTLRYSTSVPSQYELILKGQGLSGTEEIFVGFRTYDSIPSDYYNINVAVFNGYTSSNAFSAQPGIRESGVAAHNQSIDYWIIVNAQRIAFCLKVGTPVYESAYVGKIFPYATPSQYPYPVAVIGMFNGSAAVRYSEVTHTMGYKGNRSNCALRVLDGSYKTPLTYPWCNVNLASTTTTDAAEGALRDTGGQYPILPAVMCEATPNVFGELDGIGYVSNFNNTVESVIQVGGTPVTDNPLWTSTQRVDAIVAAGGVAHICFQDVARTSFTDYFTMRMS